MERAVKLTVRDLGRDVMGDVCLANAVQDVGADGTHEVAVDGCKGASGESPLLGRVVGCDDQQGDPSDL